MAGKFTLRVCVVGVDKCEDAYLLVVNAEFRNTGGEILGKPSAKNAEVEACGAKNRGHLKHGNICNCSL